MQHVPKFTDADVVNPEDCIWDGYYNPHNVRPFLLHDHGFTLAVAFADCLRDAIDEAGEAGKLDRYIVEPDVIKSDYPKEEDRERLEFFDGKEGAYDLESLHVVELTAPKQSFTVLYDHFIRESSHAR